MQSNAVSTLVVCALAALPVWCDPLLTFDAPDADQGVAVDADHVYVIDNRVVAQHDKETGDQLARWEAPKGNAIIHMNSGMVHNDRLFVAHSNYPFLPMTGSLEIFDAKSLTHLDSHSFGITDGSFTWMDRHDGHWWACFVHYDHDAEKEKGNAWTRVVKMNDAFQPLEAWVLPKSVLDALAPDSASGGAWGPDGCLYLSGHDKPELYALTLPESGSTLIHTGTYAFRNQGQAIAFDRSGTGLLYGIVRKTSRVVAAPFEEVLDHKR
jgi:hypothetical protein